jgi:cytidyltransferase-like protein
MNSRRVVISGAFDRIQGREVRLLEEAGKLGELAVLLWSDELANRLSGKKPEFSEAERRYCLEAIRFVHAVHVIDQQSAADKLPNISMVAPAVWVVPAAEHNEVKKAFCHERGMGYSVIGEEELTKFPEDNDTAVESTAGRKKVVVTGCYDWFHSGHVRFCEEASGYGDLYVVVGSDANVRLLKGEGHPLFSQRERRYVAASLRFVKQAVVSTGSGWLDGDPEIRRIKPDIFLVNEDGNKGGKREYCEKLGIEYRVLKRTPAPGLPARNSTDLRGF